MDGLGRRFIRSLIDEQDLTVLSRFNLSGADLFDDAKKAFDWTENYVRGKGSWPTAKMVEENVTGLELDDVPEPLQYTADLIRQRKLASALEGPLKDTIECIENRKPDDAYKILKATAARLSFLDDSPEITSFRESGEDRYEAYKNAKLKSGLLGLPTPWSKLNHSIQGWVNGTFNVVAAMANTGKTWMACICAEHSERHNFKTLFVTLEMSKERIARRLDALRYNISFGKLRNCELAVDEELEWRKALQDAAAGPHTSDILIADKEMVRYVSDVDNLVMEYGPDVVYIDGGYRFEAQGNQGSWESTVNIVGDLQRYAEKSDIPWIVTTQMGDANETGKKKKSDNKVRAWNVRYGKEWYIHPDTLIAMYQDADLRMIKNMEFHTLKVRDAFDVYEKFNIKWDMDKMDFDELEPHTVSAEEEAYGSHTVTF